MDNSYSYDAMQNIVGISNGATVEVDSKITPENYTPVVESPLFH